MVEREESERERGDEKDVRELARTTGKGPEQGKEERSKQRRWSGGGLTAGACPSPRERESGTDSSKRLQKEDPPWSWRRLAYCCCAPLRSFRPGRNSIRSIGLPVAYY
jgi:hypothetical protein